ncbi:TPA: enterotoxin A family protein, partial [Escherichia coli]
LSNIAYSNDLFRADTRAPNQLRRVNGLLPRGQDDAYERGTPININLFDHVMGMPTGNTRYDDGYVSTTTTLNEAHNIGQNMFGGSNEYYIYVISPAPNMFDVNGVLGRYSPHPYENEVAALGGIPFSQIIGWYRVNFGVIETPMVRNRAYRSDLFHGLNIAPNEDGYRLAGFPDGHQAWREEPWRRYAPLQCSTDLRVISIITCHSIINGLSNKKLSDLKKKLLSVMALPVLLLIDDF